MWCWFLAFLRFLPPSSGFDVMIYVVLCRYAVDRECTLTFACTVDLQMIRTVMRKPAARSSTSCIQIMLGWQWGLPQAPDGGPVNLSSWKLRRTNLAVIFPDLFLDLGAAPSSQDKMLQPIKV
jgi:hypothetical protein